MVFYFFSGAHGYCYIFCVSSQSNSVCLKAKVETTHILELSHMVWLSPWVPQVAGTLAVLSDWYGERPELA